MTKSQKNTIEFFNKYTSSFIKNPEKKLFGVCIKKETKYIIRISSEVEFEFLSIEDLIKEGWIID